MDTHPASDEALNTTTDADALVQRILPGINPHRQDRAEAWSAWQEQYGRHALLRFVCARNNTREADEDIIQDTLLTAYLGVESGRYQPREGVPFAAYVVGIARNKIREARRRERHLADLDETEEEIGLHRAGSLQRQPERVIERREQREQLQRGIAQLPEARRQVIEQVIAGASTGEIAGRMAISEDLVRQHKCRGVRALQRSFLAGPLPAVLAG